MLVQNWAIKSYFIIFYLIYSWTHSPNPWCWKFGLWIDLSPNKSHNTAFLEISWVKMRKIALMFIVMSFSKHHCFCIPKTEEPILTFDKSQKICQRTPKNSRIYIAKFAICILVRLDSLLFVEIYYHTVMTSTKSSAETSSNNSEFYKINSCFIDILQDFVCGAFNNFPKCRIKNY